MKLLEGKVKDLFPIDIHFLEGTLQHLVAQTIAQKHAQLLSIKVLEI